MTYRIGSLFSGAGGLDMAVEQVFGGTTVWHSEIDKAASTVLAHRWPDVPNLNSITEIDWAAVEPVDVLCGGFPCQDVSAAGKRAGIKDGTRSGLWAVFADAIDALRPRYVVIENVRGLLSATAHRNLESGDAVVGDAAGRPVLRAAGAVLGDLADLRYDAQWVTYAAGDVGAPHRRERVFIVATDTTRAGAGDNFGRVWGLPEQGVGGSDLPLQSLDLLQTPQARDGKRLPGSGFNAGNLRSQVINLLPTPCTGDGQGGREFGRNGTQINLKGIARVLAGDTSGLPDCRELTALLPPNAQDGNGGGRYSSDGHQKTLPGEARLLPTPQVKVSKAEELLCTPSASDGAGGKTSRSGSRINEPLLGGQAREISQQGWGKYAPAIARWEALTRPAPAPTEPNKNGNPRLAAAFSEWMMGWPAGHVTDPAIGLSRNDQLRIVGNGVCPQQATAALTWLLQIAEVAA